MTTMPFCWACWSTGAIVLPATGITQIASTCLSCTHCCSCCSWVDGSPLGSADTTVSPLAFPAAASPSASPLRAGTCNVNGEKPIRRCWPPEPDDEPDDAPPAASAEVADD